MTTLGQVFPPITDPSGGLADPMTTAGDMIRRSLLNVTERFGIGPESTILASLGGIPVWGEPAVGDDGNVATDDDGHLIFEG